MAKRGQDAERWLPEAQAGSQEAVSQALEACRGYLLLIAQRELAPDLRAKAGASDLVQDTIMEAQRDFAGFRGGSETELLAWLRRLLLNNMANFTRQFRATDKRQIGREVVLEESDSSAQPGAALASALPSPSGAAMAHERAEAVQQALAKLPVDYRRVVILRYQEERTFEEIGQLMGRSANAVRKLWVRAIERLEQELKELP
jgi:RNA polymerase sigma-70 factor (ECF subfamily)